jgi:hypothetical protein
MVTFAHHNLLDPVPLTAAGGLWDVILCRNVLIYFTREAAQKTLGTLSRALAPGGHLLLGASEVVVDVPRGLEARYVENRLAFARVDPEAARAPKSDTLRRDWLLPTTGSAPTGLVSALPFSLPPRDEPRADSAPPSSNLDDALRAGPRDRPSPQGPRPLPERQDCRSS